MCSIILLLSEIKTSIYIFFENDILFNPNGCFFIKKQQTIEFYLKEYRSMDETSFILAHGKDPFHTMNNFDIFIELYTEVKTNIGIPDVR